MKIHPSLHNFRLIKHSPLSHAVTIAALRVLDIGSRPRLERITTSLLSTEASRLVKRGRLASSNAHQVGTAAVMPRDLGGVVDGELRVYGTRGLRVVDFSILPLIPGAHTMATAYAIAEKAADLIRAAGREGR